MSCHTDDPLRDLAVLVQRLALSLGYDRTAEEAGHIIDSLDGPSDYAEAPFGADLEADAARERAMERAL